MTTATTTGLDLDLVAEIEDAGTPDAQIPYSMMELTRGAEDQATLESYLLDIAARSPRTLVRSMAVECMGHLVRERRRLTTDRVPLFVCEAHDDSDLITRDNARIALDEIRYWLAPRRRGQVPLPTDSVRARVTQVRLVVAGSASEGLVVGEPDDPSVRRILAVVGPGVVASRGVRQEILAALNLPRARRGAVFQHVDDPRHVPWYAWAFGPGEAPGAAYVPPRLLRIEGPRVSARGVRSLLETASGARVELMTTAVGVTAVDERAAAQGRRAGATRRP
ncbi:hypothetical protein GXP71_17600 [Cellulomonas sp. H30R-01]|uniref:hypothetical protein n=1 Tax=Cellulomonas sp. H30R-01 TaxID=2704467 RepID=UPI00138D049A|nr:hypothetical protein [Cellulomonas sp. H30R-01]QHT57710.1 hypothetical protein GXP71_17600 [Cellulomonas sp. H30R-01]